MNILVLCGDNWHSSKVIKTALESLNDDSACIYNHQFDYLTNCTDFIKDDTNKVFSQTIANYDQIILAKANHISEYNSDPWLNAIIVKQLTEYVLKGKQLVVLHSGLVGYSHLPEMVKLVGGHFNYHPAQCLVTLKASCHELTPTFSPFTALDEHYFIDNFADKTDVFLTATSEHGTQPAGWKLEHGKGTVFVLTPSHNESIWLQPSLQTLLKTILRMTVKRNNGSLTQGVN